MLGDDSRPAVLQVYVASLQGGMRRWWGAHVYRVPLVRRAVEHMAHVLARLGRAGVANVRHQIELGADGLLATGRGRSVHVILQLQVLDGEGDEGGVLLDEEVVELEALVVQDEVARQRVRQPEPAQQPAPQLLRGLAVEFLLRDGKNTSATSAMPRARQALGVGTAAAAFPVPGKGRPGKARAGTHE